jgi:hypothetical protein
MAVAARVELPRFGTDALRPEIPLAVYRRRLARAREAMASRKLDALVVYGDREHSANLAYLTGFDPRFEEAILVLARGDRPLLLVGNECMGYLPDKGLGLRVEMFQELSLMGQPRDRSRPLRAILAGAGIGKGRRVGCAGWKHFGGPLLAGGELVLEVPAYLADLLRDLAGGKKHVVNAGPIFTDVERGLRMTCEAEQIVRFEHAACVSSDGVRALLAHLKPGVVEADLERHLDSRGLPLSCHRMVSFGAKAARGLASAGNGAARRGDAFTTALGVEGALTARAGVVARGAGDLPRALRGFYPRFVASYFDMVAAWYGALRVGAVAGEVVAAVEARRDPSLLRLALNPGHAIHLDEWTHSPFVPGGTVRLASGSVFQADLIPISAGPFCCSNVEDGVALADEKLRGTIARMAPAMWKRVQRRRAFMRDALGIELDESVLPLGNTPAWLPPYAMDLRTAMVAR